MWNLNDGEMAIIKISRVDWLFRLWLGCLKPERRCSTFLPEDWYQRVKKGQARHQHVPQVDGWDFSLVQKISLPGIDPAHHSKPGWVRTLHLPEGIPLPGMNPLSSLRGREAFVMHVRNVYLYLWWRFSPWVHMVLKTAILNGPCDEKDHTIFFFFFG